MSMTKTLPTRRALLFLCLTLSPLLLIAAVLIASRATVQASSHREAPLISKDPFADTTDVYMFISPENPDNVVFIASWIPFQAPEGGPNYFEWDKTALYDIYVDNNGDASPDITYTLSSNYVVENPGTFLYNVGPIGLNGANWNRKQYITITEQFTGNAPTVLVGNKLAAPVNIGSKSTPNYETYYDAAVTSISTAQGAGKVFAGQTDDAFWVDLQVFDLLTLRGQPAPIGYADGNNIPVDSVSAHNVHSLVIEVPIAHVTSPGEPVIGMWAGTRRPTTRVLSLGGQTTSVTYTQVSRLGMPLVNEVVIPMGLKDVFNGLPPEKDLDVYGLLQKSVEDPELATLLCLLYGVPVPNPVNQGDQKCNTQFTPGTPRSGRGDIFDIFITGIKLTKPLVVGNITIPAGTNFTQPQSVRPAEMLRLNTALHKIPNLCPTTPQRLGVLAGDLCGFPNGRRLTDDIVEIELRAVAGAVYQLLDGADPNFTYNPAFDAVLDDGVDYNDVPFYGASDRQGHPTKFPYMAPPHSGQSHWHMNPFFNILAGWVQNGAASE